MATDEKIDALREEVAAYHVEVREHIVRFDACDGAVRVLQADVYGVPGERGEHPGLIGDVRSLKKSRRVMLTGLKCAWALLLLLAGTIGNFIYGAVR